MGPRLGLAIIARDEEESLPRLLKSIEGAFDRVVLLDTGSQDQTVEVFKAWCDEQRKNDATFASEVGRMTWVNDFSAARRAADNLLMYGTPEVGKSVVSTGESFVDWTSWADCDDTITGAENLRQLAAEADPNVAALAFGYNYAQDPASGQMVCHLRRERLVRAGKGTWEGRVHEAQVINGFVASIPDEVVQWVHHKGLNEGGAHSSNSRNLTILEDWVKEEPANPRVLAYLGKERAASGRHVEAIAAYQAYIALDPQWTEERAQLYRALANSMWAIEAPLEDIEVIAWEGVKRTPTWPDNWITLAEIYLKRGDGMNCLWALQRVIEAGVPETVMIINPLDYLAYPHRLAAGALAGLGNFPEAIAAAERALQHVPQDETLIQGWNQWRAADKRNRTAETYVLAAEQLIAHDEQLKALTLLEECVPVFAQDHPRIVQMRSMIRRRMAWVFDPSAFALHYEEGGSQPEDFHTDEQADQIAEMLPRVGYLLAGLTEQQEAMA